MAKQPWLERLGLLAALACGAEGFLSCDYKTSNAVTPTDGQPGASLTASHSPSFSPHFVEPGAYGGENVLASVSGEGADFKFACARGKISHPIETDAQGGFDTTGTYEAQSGPVPPEGYSELEARYFGFAADGRLHFEVDYSDDEGRAMRQVYDAFLCNPPHFTLVCALAAPSESPSPAVPGPSGAPSPESLPPPMHH